jgi:DNA-binding transcriptional ArsR family regulator
VLVGGHDGRGAAGPAQEADGGDPAGDRSAGAAARWRVAVVPAFNEERTVAAVLERLYGLVDELVVVDDGSTDGTRAAIEAWLPGRERATLCTFDRNRGMSAAYYLAFCELARRVRAGDLDPDAFVCTVDADGQHELNVLDELVRTAADQRLDALIARRDLSDYPAFKRAGNWVLSRWATWWAGARLFDVESGYRVFRAAALADALRYYRGYRYSETVEVAVVLCRLGYRVRNDLPVPVPVVRSRTRMRDAVIDVVMIMVASCRVAWRRPRGVGSTTAPVPVPVRVPEPRVPAATLSRRSDEVPLGAAAPLGEDPAT